MVIINDLVKGKFLRRYKRFFADCVLENGEEVIAHCPNSGSMKSLLDEGNIVYLTYNNDPKKKLRYQLQIMELKDGTKVCVNTMLPNRIVFETIKDKKIDELKEFNNIRPEVKYGNENSKIDILLEDDDKKTYVEVKNVTLMEEDLLEIAQFPDAVTSRGEKHLRELENEVKNSNRSIIFFLVNRTDCHKFKVASHIDKKYNEAYIKSKENGVETFIFNTNIDLKENGNNKYDCEITIDKKLDYFE